MLSDSQRKGPGLPSLELPLRSADESADAIRCLLASGFDNIPLPASGDTLERWTILSRVGATDLNLAKLYESHVDAVAILAELGHAAATTKLHAVWAAESPADLLTFDPATRTLTGRKSWCSGTAAVEVGLLTAKSADGPVLVRVEMDQPSAITTQATPWFASGMSACGTGTIDFAAAHAEPVGRSGLYLSRPGFWHGGAGIAAVWLGATGELASTFAAAMADRDDPHALAHLGSVDVGLAAALALLRETAAWIDAHPTDDAFVPAMRLRLFVEAAAIDVLERTARAMGPGPFCSDPQFAQRRADLELFLRQSHAERDLATLGDRVRHLEASPW